MRQIVDISPRAAIMEMRRELEEALRGVAKEYDLAPRVPMSRASITRMLRSRKLIDLHTSALLDDFRVVGNAAAPGSNETEFSKEDALRYRKLADEIIGRLASKRVLTAERESREGSRSG